MTKPTRCADETVAARETTTVAGDVEGRMAASMTSQIIRSFQSFKTKLPFHSSGIGLWLTRS